MRARVAVCAVLASLVGGFELNGARARGVDRSLRPRRSLLRLSGGASEEPFTFEDGMESCKVIFPIDDDVKSKQVVYSVEKSCLTLGVAGAPPAIESEPLWGRVVAEDCYCACRPRALTHRPARNHTERPLLVGPP